jgi:hypothetical protein
VQLLTKQAQSHDNVGIGSSVDIGLSNNDDLTLAQASFQLSPQAQQNAKAKMLKSGSSVVCSSRTP